MSETGSIEYAQARLCARYGQRPDDLAWRRIEHVRSFAGMLDVARTSPLRSWMTGIGPTSTAHEIEALLRGQWQALVADVARWMPAPWSAAVRWCAMAADLPFVSHLARGGATLPWMRDDPTFRALCEGEASAPGTAPVDGPLVPLAAAWTEPGRIGHLWRDEWRRRLPARHAGDPRLVDELGRVISAHLGAFRDPSVNDGWPLRRALQARLALLFRRAMLDPAAAFVFLALAALDLERLRGELLRRAAFPAPTLAT
jgi:hypothetical protein